jgi:L-fuculose-phosphate aldolase
VSGDGKPAPPASAKAQAAASPANDRLFSSPEAEAAKAEIIAAGRKLWQRSYVDGNGGNISIRLGENAVLCTPTLVSKADLRPEDLCLVDLDGNQLAGTRARTSEILMHLEIYKHVPEAKAVLHCHPPHATAYAITGRVPPTCVIPEFEVFVGGAALAKYETPGTQAFAEAVLPFVKNHNTLLLQNHGIVCWADTVTHAEWYAEVLDTYCWTLMLAQQLGAPITYIPQDKAADLLAIKKRLGLPDSRLDGGSLKECQLCDLPDMPGAIAVPPPAPGGRCPCAGNGTCPAGGKGDDVETLVAAVTDAVMGALQK